jgi:hypothetical protein
MTRVDRIDEIRRRLRIRGRDTWVGDSPTRAEIEELLHGEQTMLDVVFGASIPDVLCASSRPVVTSIVARAGQSAPGAAVHCGNAVSAALNFATGLRTFQASSRSR